MISFSICEIVCSIDYAATTTQNCYYAFLLFRCDADSLVFTINYSH